MLNDRIPRLQLAGIHKRFPGVYALRDIEFDLYDGEVHALLGENGAGKSTLINVIAGNYIPDEGKIYVQGQETTFLKPDDALKHGVAVVYQELNVVDTLSIALWRQLGSLFFGAALHLFHQFIRSRPCQLNRKTDRFAQVNQLFRPLCQLALLVRKHGGNYKHGIFGAAQRITQQLQILFPIGRRLQKRQHFVSSIIE